MSKIWDAVGKLGDYAQRCFPGEQRLDYLESFLVSNCRRAFDTQYRDYEQLVRGARTTSDGRLAYDVVVLFGDRQNGRVTGASAYRKKRGFGNSFDRRNVWGTKVIDISDEVSLDEAKVEICRELRKNDNRFRFH